jgi:DNA-binding transcriptional regulator YdaS (Cro superfamily)
MTITERKKEAKFLKHGDMLAIAKAAGMHPTSISKWINGHLKESACEVFFQELVNIRKAEVVSKIQKVA